MTAPDPHPLDRLREEAQTTTPQAVRAALDTLSAGHFALLIPQGWAAGAEETLRGAIGMERKAQMEMRIGLEGELDDLPIRKTTALAEMTLGELLAEYRENRVMTLRVLDRLLEAAQRRDVRAWTLGEEVPPAVYILSLRGRLERLGERVAEQRVNP